MMDSPLTNAQAKELELIFHTCPHPDATTLCKLARRLEIPEAQIKVILKLFRFVKLQLMAKMFEMSAPNCYYRYIPSGITITVSL